MDKLDQEIKTLVARVIKLPEEKIDPRADLFNDLGVDSLLAVEILSALDKKYQLDIPEAEVRKIHNLEELTALVRRMSTPR